MSYQQCPICYGRGTTYTGLTTDAVCPTCRGARIIDSVTGLPPIQPTVSATTTDVILDSGRVQEIIIYESGIPTQNRTNKNQ